MVLPRRTTVVGTEAESEVFAVETPFPNFDQVIAAGLGAFAQDVATGKFACVLEDTAVVSTPIENIDDWIAYQRGATLDSEHLEAALAILDAQRAAHPNALLTDREDQTLHIYRKQS